MTKKELKELDEWICDLMEKRPNQVPLRDVRQKNDGRYNVATQTSPLGYWECETGTDAENKNMGDATMCIWSPHRKPASEPECSTSRLASIEVLRKCLKHDAYSVGSWIKQFSDDRSNFDLEICLLAKNFFSE